MLPTVQGEIDIHMKAAESRILSMDDVSKEINEEMACAISGVQSEVQKWGDERIGRGGSEETELKKNCPVFGKFGSTP